MNNALNNICQPADKQYVPLADILANDAKLQDAARGDAEIPPVSATLLGPDAKLLAQSETCAVFELVNETGRGVVTVYEAFAGVYLTYNDMHLEKIGSHDDIPIGSGGEVFVIEHCREGRYECEFPWGEHGYISEGDLAISQMPPPIMSSRFPLKHYHGISIMLDVQVAAASIAAVLAGVGAAHLDVRAIKDRLLDQRPYLLMRSSDEVSHIFSELYDAPDSLKDIYIRLKLIELLLFLSVVEPGEEATRRYFYKTRVRTVEAMRDYLTANLDRQFTLEELSKQWGIPMTAMKTCFKSLYGAPIHAYMRDYRMQTAASLLRETDEPVAAIASSVGYESHTQFSAAFKATMGMTPMRYRKTAVRNLGSFAV